MKQLDLQQIRGQLDQIDSQLVELFEERMKLCGEVAEFKIRTGKAVYDGEREKQKLEVVTGKAHGDFNKKGVYELFSQIMTISRRLQYRLLSEHGIRGDMGFTMVEQLNTDGIQVVYQGTKGAYQHGAALRFFGETTPMYHVKTFEDVMVEVEEGRADYGVLPIENSSAGAVSDNYDNLVKHNLYIVAEIQLPVNHALLGVPGAELSDIRKVYSHSQALMQCSRYLDSHREWVQMNLENTAVAAQKVIREGDISQAAVASPIAGQLYGLKTLAEGINNDTHNTTRFIVLSRQPVYTRSASKVSICFEGLHKSGSLYNMLGNFIYNDVNMLMIESRPIEGRSWEYRFFVDVEGSLADGPIQNALKGIAAEAVSLRILGNY